MARTGSVVVMVVGVLGLANCSSSSGGGGTPSELSPAAKAKWDGYCAARMACLPDSDCPPSTCLAPIAEEGPLVEFVDCQSAKACGANDDDCFASAGTSDAERDAFVSRCAAALSALQTSPTCYMEPVLCTIVAYPIIRKQILRAVDACLGKPCPEVKTCIDAAIEPLGCW